MGTPKQGDILLQAEILAKGLRNNLAKVTPRGIDEGWVVDLEAQRQQVVDLESEQETLKALLKEKTEILDRKRADLLAKIGEGKKVVKLQIPQARWKEFSIADAR